MYRYIFGHWLAVSGVQGGLATALRDMASHVQPSPLHGQAELRQVRGVQRGDRQPRDGDLCRDVPRRAQAHQGAATCAQKELVRLGSIRFVCACVCVLCVCLDDRIHHHFIRFPLILHDCPILLFPYNKYTIYLSILFCVTFFSLSRF